MGCAQIALEEQEDHYKPQEMAGSELMEKGLVINIPDCLGAVIITYKKIGMAHK